MTTLFRGGTIHTLAGDRPGWLLVEGPQVVGSGSVDDMPAAAEVVDLGDAVLVPGFCDAHAHLPATGLQAAGVDVRGETSATAILDALAARAPDPDAILYAVNLEEPFDGAFTCKELDRACGGRPALVARADLHSCIVSSAVLDAIDLEGIEGVELDPEGEPTGYLREKAAAEGWRWFDSHLPREQMAEAMGAAVRLAYSKGITSLHEMYVVEWRGWDPLEVLTETLDEHGLHVVLYVATDDVARVTDMGLRTIGGDWFLDGSFGSHTAWMRDGYVETLPAGMPQSGVAYRTDGEVAAYFDAAQRAGLQVGVHAIGDAAIDQAVRSWEEVARTHGLDEVRALRHRLEHFECADDDLIRRAVVLGLTGSVQPAFDRFWGGPDGLYSRRIGWERASVMNRFKTMQGGGMRLGAGSDSTVTPLDPFLQMGSLRLHHLEGERLTPLQALEAHTVGGHYLAHEEGKRGRLAAGMAADLVILDRDPLLVTAESMIETKVLGTWCGGRKIWPEVA